MVSEIDTDNTTKREIEWDRQVRDNTHTQTHTNVCTLDNSLINSKNYT